MKDESNRFVAKHVAGIPRSGIRDFFSIASQMKDAISLGIGEPDFVTPWHIREAAIYALEKGRTSYTDNRGLIQLRTEISGYVQRRYHICYNPETEILVGVGVSENLDLALRALINPGEKVLYHEPCYVSYSPSVALTHGEAIGVPTSAKDNFAITPEALAAAWQPGCKVLMLNFPTNPTGGTVDRVALEKIAAFVKEKDMVVLSDEIYSELTFEGEHVSIASLPGMKERTVFLHGFSKAFAMTGFRIGYACGPAHIIEAMMKIHQYSMLCAPILSQEAALEALRRGEPDMEKMREQYRRRRDYIVARFNELGLPCHLPRGSFYAFPNISSVGMPSFEFATRLIQEAKVAMVPGTAFGPSGAGFVRAAFCTSYENLMEATNRLGRWLDKNRPR